MPTLDAEQLRAAIDAAWAEAERQGARPFRIHLQDAEIQALTAAGVLAPKKADADTSSGSYRDVHAYPMHVSELLAQPSDRNQSLYLPLHGPEPPRSWRG